MKHLKKFNENKENFKEELQNFVKTNLAYLLDESELSIVESPGGNGELLLIYIKLFEPKTWLEIEDDIIPFLTLLNEEYKISSKLFDNQNIRFRIRTDYPTNSRKYKEDSVENLIKDEPNLIGPDEIDEICIYIEKPKEPTKGIITKLKSFFLSV